MNLDFFIVARHVSLVLPDVKQVGPYHKYENTFSFKYIKRECLRIDNKELDQQHTYNLKTIL